MIMSSYRMQGIKNVMDKMREITCFYGMSPKKQLLLDETIKRVLPKCKHTKRISVCQTRWVARLDVMARFIELYPTSTGGFAYHMRQL